VPAKALEVPYLVLHRNGSLTDPGERSPAFVVQVWRLFDPEDGSKPRLAAERGGAPAILDATNTYCFSCWSTPWPSGRGLVPRSE